MIRVFFNKIELNWIKKKKIELNIYGDIEE